MALPYMKIAAATVSMGLATLLAGAPASATAPFHAPDDPHPPVVPAEATAAAPPGEQDPLPDLGAASGLSLDAYADSLDYDVSYDDAVAARYDDGYDPEAYRQFDVALAPYGTWVDDPAYGHVWVPSAAEVGDDFTPYATNGDWLDTEYGWTWSSGWSWGWAPFHYGRWVGSERGWAWVPGTLWGPAWVSWRSGGGYVGWAPLPPRGVSLASPIGVHSPWRFMAQTALGRSRGPYLPPRLVPSAFMRTSVVANTRLLPDGVSQVQVNTGPAVERRAGGRVVPPVRLASAAPRSLPRFAIRSHAGAPPSDRPWVLSGATGQFARDYRRQRSFAEPSFGAGAAGPAAGYARGGDWSAARGRGGSGGAHHGAGPGREGRGAASSDVFFIPSFSYSSSTGGHHDGGGSAPASSGFTAPTPAFTAPTTGFTATPLLFTGASSGRSTSAPTYGRAAAPAPPFHAGAGSHGAGGRHR